MSGNDVPGSDVSGSDSDASERVSLDDLDMDGIEVDELCDSDDFVRLDSAHKSNSDGQNWPEFNLENDMSNPRLKMILEARGKPILTMMETIRTKIMLLIVKKKKEADKWKGILCPKIKKKLDVNIKDSLRCVPLHAGGDKYQVECGLGSQHVVDLVQNSCSCRNWDLTGILCIYALAVIHVKNEFPETYVQTWLKDIKLVFEPSNRLP
ncbi:far1-related sequence 1 -like protein [Gossypium arboreum]|uniref:Far1-related sequence 1-like protein n=1 Tax=Gossypium arboreum TaxID=29729 RepID=A0A0B0NC86_GOSAR|nr:far1-related sequence 1 -like protein [Gossypium arboreum]